MSVCPPKICLKKFCNFKREQKHQFLLFPAAPGMFERERCDVIDWCKTGGINHISFIFSNTLRFVYKITCTYHVIADILVGDYNNDGLDDLFCSSDNKTCVAPSEIRRKVITLVQIQFKQFVFIDLPRKVRIILITYVCLALVVDYIQTDWDSEIKWNGTKFCVDKEIYEIDANGDNR